MPRAGLVVAFSAVTLLSFTGCSRKEDRRASPPEPPPLASATTPDVRAPACDRETVRAIAEVYALSLPMWNGSLEDPIGPKSRLARYVGESSDLFVEGGKAIVCARALSAKLIGPGEPSTPSAEGRAIENLANAPPDVVSKIPTDLDAGSTDATSVGIELQWLAQTLPRVVSADFEPYNSTGTPARLQVRKILPAYRMRLTSDPTMMAALNRVFAKARSGLETYLLAVAASL